MLLVDKQLKEALEAFMYERNLTRLEIIVEAGRCKIEGAIANGDTLSANGPGTTIFNLLP